MTVEPKRPAIVIAEDDEDVARLLAEALTTELGADPVLVTNGALVIDAVVASAARLLVLDVQMPGASGIDVYDVVRGHPILAEIPVLFVTADPATALETLPGRAPRAVIGKPFDVDALLAKVRELLGDAVQA